MGSAAQDGDLLHRRYWRRAQAARHGLRHPPFGNPGILLYGMLLSIWIESRQDETAPQNDTQPWARLAEASNLLAGAASSGEAHFIGRKPNEARLPRPWF